MHAGSIGPIHLGNIDLSNLLQQAGNALNSVSLGFGALPQPGAYASGGQLGAYSVCACRLAASQTVLPILLSADIAACLLPRI